MLCLDSESDEENDILLEDLEETDIITVVVSSDKKLVVEHWSGKYYKFRVSVETTFKDVFWYESDVLIAFIITYEDGTSQTIENENLPAMESTILEIYPTIEKLKYFSSTF
jgi:hypothetical protein